MWDWKTKYADYDLRISITGSDILQDLAHNMEERCYHRGRKEEVIEKLKNYPDLEGQWSVYNPLHKLEEILRKKEDN